MSTTDLRDGGAPPLLAAVAGFVNTRAITKSSPTAREDLHDPGALDDWAGRHLACPGPPSGPAELADAIAVREGLRALLARHNDAARPEDDRAIAALTAVTDRIDLTGSAVADPLAPRPGSGPIGALLVRVVTARLTGDWSRLKVCRDPHCREAFYDGSKNRSRAWCSMAVCGARSKQRAMTARRRAGAAAP